MNKTLAAVLALGLLGLCACQTGGAPASVDAYSSAVERFGTASGALAKITTEQRAEYRNDRRLRSVLTWASALAIVDEDARNAAPSILCAPLADDYVLSGKIGYLASTAEELKSVTGKSPTTFVGLIAALASDYGISPDLNVGASRSDVSGACREVLSASRYWLADIDSQGANVESSLATSFSSLFELVDTFILKPARAAMTTADRQKRARAVAKFFAEPKNQKLLTDAVARSEIAVDAAYRTRVWRAARAYEIALAELVEARKAALASKKPPAACTPGEQELSIKAPVYGQIEEFTSSDGKVVKITPVLRVEERREKFMTVDAVCAEAWQAPLKAQIAGVVSAAASFDKVYQANPGPAFDGMRAAIQRLVEFGSDPGDAVAANEALVASLANVLASIAAIEKLTEDRATRDKFDKVFEELKDLT